MCACSCETKRPFSSCQVALGFGMLQSLHYYSYNFFVSSGDEEMPNDYADVYMPDWSKNIGRMYRAQRAAAASHNWIRLGRR